jgi:hypothetical protein
MAGPRSPRGGSAANSPTMMPPQTYRGVTGAFGTHSVASAEGRIGGEEGNPSAVGSHGPSSEPDREDTTEQNGRGLGGNPGAVGFLYVTAVRSFGGRHLGGLRSDSLLKAECVRWRLELASAKEESLTWAKRDGPRLEQELHTLLREAPRPGRREGLYTLVATAP